MTTAAARPPRPVALVTGASSGIGKAFVERLAADGYDLVIVARDADRLKVLAAELERSRGAHLEILPADLTDPTQRAAVEERLSRVDGAGAIDLLVNNAGFGTGGSFHDLPIGPEIGQIELNVVALVRLTHPALAVMVPRRSG